ncbi:MAG TPA: CHRD domain-containing protein [Pyrinomonadaceae bacterium]|nr:CHRD domain-containing protein [Pyrinomonadaceae bacterium]
MRNRSLTLILATVFLTALSGTARAETFTAYLTGAQEVPAVATTATGYARIVVNEGAGTINFTVVFNGLSSAQTQSHIHAPAAIGATVGVAINFGTVGGTSGTISGSAAITPTQISQLRAHLGYVNVHSSNFPGGEIRGQLGVQRPVDYDGDGRTDMSVLRFPDIAPPGVAPITWWNSRTTGSTQIVDWGNANTDFPAPGDYDGDAIADIAIFRGGATVGAQSEYWILQSSNSTVRYFAWGIRGDQTHQRDYDGDGITDIAVVRRGAAATDQMVWYIRNSSTGTARIEPFGLTGDTVGGTSGDAPISGDYDGDGKFDIAVYRFGLTPANNFIIMRSSDSAITYQRFGNFTSDYVLPGDYDGDGKYDLAVARTGATGTSPLVWWILNSSNGSTRTQTFGRSSDEPVQGDYDGDGRTDLAIWRRGATPTTPSIYWILNSFDLTTRTTAWGVGADFSVNTFDIR